MSSLHLRTSIIQLNSAEQDNRQSYRATHHQRRNAGSSRRHPLSKRQQRMFHRLLWTEHEQEHEQPPQGRLRRGVRKQPADQIGESADLSPIHPSISRSRTQIEHTRAPYYQTHDMGYQTPPESEPEPGPESERSSEVKRGWTGKCDVWIWE